MKLPTNHQFSCYIDLDVGQSSDPDNLLDLKDGMGQVSWEDPEEVQRFKLAVQAGADRSALRRCVGLPEESSDEPQARRRM